MKKPGRRETADDPDQPNGAGAPGGSADGEIPTRINLGDHSAGSAAATIRKVGELLGYVVVANGPASFRLTRPVRRGIRRVDQVVTVSLTGGRDGLWVDHDGPIDPRLIEQLEAQARTEHDDAPAAPTPPPPVANLPRSDRDQAPVPHVRPGAAPLGLIDSVPGSVTGSVSSSVPSSVPAPSSVRSSVPSSVSGSVPSSVSGSGPVSASGPVASDFPPPPPNGARHALVIHLPNGTTAAGDQGVVIGRDPDIGLQSRCAVALAVDDPGVSKTHVAVWPDGGAITIEDLHSTNGSTVVAGGETQKCEAGQPVTVDSQSVTLLIGSATIGLERRP